MGSAVYITVGMGLIPLAFTMLLFAYDKAQAHDRYSEIVYVAAFGLFLLGMLSSFLAIRAERKEKAETDADREKLRRTLDTLNITLERMNEKDGGGSKHGR